MVIEYRLAEAFLVPKIGLLIRVMGAATGERLVPIAGRIEEICSLATRDAVTGGRGIKRCPSHRQQVSGAQEAFPCVQVKGGVMEGPVALVQDECDVVGFHCERHEDSEVAAVGVDDMLRHVKAEHLRKQVAHCLDVLPMELAMIETLYAHATQATWPSLRLDLGYSPRAGIGLVGEELDLMSGSG